MWYNYITILWKGGKMDYEVEANKPKDWPANAREFSLEQICKAAKEFRENPNYKSRELLLALISQHDLNQGGAYGLMRVTEYEVGIINYLYILGSMLQMNSIKVYLYELVGATTRLQKMSSWFSPIIHEESDINIKAYDEGLILSLKLYHYAYQIFNVEKDKTFAEQIVYIVNEILGENPNEEVIATITQAYVSMLNDISYMHGNSRNNIWKFTREELELIFRLEAKLIKLNLQSPIVRPLKGVLMTQISNYILKSRNNYNEDYICKYIPKDVAKESVSNHQIWMRKTEFLNDEREQKVVPELFKDDSWIIQNWAKSIDFTATRSYYVSSFSKTINNSIMQEGYGQCVYGYKDDRIVDLVGPIGMFKLTKKEGCASNTPDIIERPYVAQVIAFDVIYDTEEAKEELQYLIKIIDLFNMSDCDKKQFLEEILQYWILSVKDYKWHNERERRYVIFLYDNYDYREVEFDDMFLKMKTTLFLTPDFILGENPGRWEIQRQLDAKQRSLQTKEYLHCKDCLMQDYDAAIMKTPDRCPICSSDKLEMIYF